MTSVSREGRSNGERGREKLPLSASGPPAALTLQTSPRTSGFVKRRMEIGEKQGKQSGIEERITHNPAAAIIALALVSSKDVLSVM